MNIRDYIRMLRRGWPVVLLGAMVFVGLSIIYLVITPKQYESSTVLLVSARNPASVTELQNGAQFSANAASTYARMIDSSAVLGPVANAIRPQLSTDQLAGMVSTATAPGSPLITITVTGQHADVVADVANRTADSAVSEIPKLDGVSDGHPLVQLKKLQPAAEQDQAVSPNKKRIIVLGFFVGCILGLAAAIAFQALDTKIRRVHDLQVLSDVPLLAVVPRMRRVKHNEVIVRDDPTGASVEAFRTLRTNIRFIDGGARKSLVLTAVAEHSDGAHIPVNLAWMLAEAGRRVLLVDLDLRNSTVSDVFGLSGGLGMTDVLDGPVRLTEVVRDTHHPNLQVVISGDMVLNPSELLSTPKMGSLLAWMEAHYDHVILHAPPLLSHSDAAVIAGIGGGVSPRQPAAPGTLITIAAGRTRAQELDTALTVLRNVGVIPLGLVLTRAGKNATDHRSASGGPTRSVNLWNRRTSHRFNWEWRTGRNKSADRHAVS